MLTRESESQRQPSTLKPFLVTSPPAFSASPAVSEEAPQEAALPVSPQLSGGSLKANWLLSLLHWLQNIKGS